MDNTLPFLTGIHASRIPADISAASHYSQPVEPRVQHSGLLQCYTTKSTEHHEVRTQTCSRVLVQHQELLLFHYVNKFLKIMYSG